MTNRELFDFVTDIALLDDEVDDRLEAIQRAVQDRLLNPPTAEEVREAEMEEALFRKAFIPTSLDQVNDIEGDIHMLEQGNEDKLYYTALVGLATVQPPQDAAGTASIEQGGETSADVKNSTHPLSTNDVGNGKVEETAVSTPGQDSDDDDSDDGDGNDSDDQGEWKDREMPSTETAEEKRLRKQAVKEANREKRKNKMPKHIKKKKHEKARK
jgi:RIO kinase 1